MCLRVCTGTGVEAALRLFKPPAPLGGPNVNGAAAYGKHGMDFNGQTYGTAWFRTHGFEKFATTKLSNGS